MKIEQMKSPRSGRPVANQFIISETGNGANGNFIRRETFQSYQTIIATKTIWTDETRIELDKDAWNYSVTTRKYRNEFLGEGTEDTRKKIKRGEYLLANLNA